VLGKVESCNRRGTRCSVEIRPGVSSLAVHLSIAVQSALKETSRILFSHTLRFCRHRHNRSGCKYALTFCCSLLAGSTPTLTPGTAISDLCCPTGAANGGPEQSAVQCGRQGGWERGSSQQDPNAVGLRRCFLTRVSSHQNTQVLRLIYSVATPYLSDASSL